MAPPSRRGSSSKKLPPLDEDTRAAAHDPELEEDLFKLVTHVAEEDGFSYPPRWASVVDAAKRRGYVEERGLRLYLKTHGKQWLANRAGPKERAYTMTKIDPATRLALKDISHDTGVPMQEAIGHIIGTLHEHRDELTRVARKANLDHPWEAIGALIRGARRA